MDWIIGLDTVRDIGPNFCRLRLINSMDASFIYILSVLGVHGVRFLDVANTSWCTYGDCSALLSDAKYSCLLYRRLFVFRFGFWMMKDHPREMRLRENSALVARVALGGGLP